MRGRWVVGGHDVSRRTSKRTWAAAVGRRRSATARAQSSPGPRLGLTLAARHGDGVHVAAARGKARILVPLSVLATDGAHVKGAALRAVQAAGLARRARGHGGDGRREGEAQRRGQGQGEARDKSAGGHPGGLLPGRSEGASSSRSRDTASVLLAALSTPELEPEAFFKGLKANGSASGGQQASGWGRPPAFECPARQV
jgi:hypothetical protein